MHESPLPPRGVSARNVGAPLATARWGSPAEAAEHAYRPGDIFLGTIPAAAPCAKAALGDLDAFRALLEKDTVIDEGWKAGQLDLIGHYADRLSSTSSLAIGVGDDRHMVTVSGSRSGKGTSCITPTLASFPGSVLTVDPKGENARLTATRRGAGSAHCEGMGQEVVVLDPYNTSRRPAAERARWNPLDQIDLSDPEAVDKAASIAEALFIRTESRDAHFDDTAQLFVKALILFVALTGGSDLPRNLLSVYDLLMRGAHADLDPDRENPAPSDAMTLLLFQMMQVSALDGIVAGAAAMLTDIGDRELGSILSTARRNLAFLERPAMREVLKESSFDLDHLKTSPRGMTIYLCLPQQRIADTGRWLRLMIASALERIYTIEDDPATGHPILFLLEEFASLGHMPMIETAAGYAAGFGVKLWIIIQDLSQLKRHYREGWETFLGNAGVVQAFGNSDPATLEYISKRLGEVEIAQAVRSVTTSVTASSNDPGDAQRLQVLLQNRGAMSIMNPLPLLFDDGGTGQSTTSTTATNEQVQRAPLMLPDEIERFFRREGMRQIVLVKGLRPLILDRVNYYASMIFAGLYEPDGRNGPKATLAEIRGEREATAARQDREARTLADEASSFVHATRKAIDKAKSSARR